MHNHFESGLNVRDIILMERPKYILELGAASGENTRQILSLKHIYDFKMIVISTGACPSDIEYNGFRWIDGVSYLEIPNLDNGIDFCSIDTDHNYWTLIRELNELHPKLSNKAIIAIHDTETYGYHDGAQHSYDGHKHIPYPDINKDGKHGLQTAITEFMSKHNEYRVISCTKESCGAMALQRENL